MKRTMITIMILIMFFMADVATATVKPKPFNRVAVVIDSSGTFKGHQFAAIEKVKGLLDKMAEQTERRYQAPDEIYILSLDALPTVIWFGKRPQLEELTSERLSELFANRSSYSHCTDVAKAFNLASNKLNRDPVPAAKYLFVFSDLIDEPPSSRTKCEPPSRPSLPPVDIHWDSLTDASISVFWAPDDQISAWMSSISDQGLNIKFYNEAEARNMELPPPPKARFKMSEEERKEKLEHLSNGIWGLIKWFLKYTLLFIGGLIGLILLSRYRGNIRAMSGQVINRIGGARNGSGK